MDVDPNENDDGTYCIARSSTDFTLLILHTMMKVVQKDNSSLYLVLSYVHQDVLVLTVRVTCSATNVEAE